MPPTTPCAFPKRGIASSATTSAAAASASLTRKPVVGVAAIVFVVFMLFILFILINSSGLAANGSRGAGTSNADAAKRLRHRDKSESGWLDGGGP